MRFGGAAGPIAFAHTRRMHNGSWDTITVPLGLALRTSALLEPHAPPGCAVVEEKFYEFGSRWAVNGAGFDRTPASADRISEELIMTPVSKSDVPNVDYDRHDEKFVVRKNLLDPPYRTRLWMIDLG